MKKTAFITGATSGIGKACAEKFAKNGYDLIITGRRNNRLLELKETFTALYNIEVTTLEFDVQSRHQVNDAIASLGAIKVDVLVNNAGLALGRENFALAEINDWDTMLQTNVQGLLYLSRAVLPFLKNSAHPHIINIGSIAGKQVYENGAVYCASKFAVDALTQGMRIDLLKDGIKVTAVNPGATETEFSVVRFKGDEEKAAAVYQNFIPLTADDIADAVFYCASLPAHVCINELTIMPTAQANSINFHKTPAG